MLQVAKFYKNHNKIPLRQSWANCGSHADLFFSSITIFCGKIVSYVCGLVDLIYFFVSMLSGGNLDSHFPKRSECVKKVEDHWSRLYGKIYFCVIESKKNYRPANFEKNVDFDSSKSSEYAATDTPTSIESSGVK